MQSDRREFRAVRSPFTPDPSGRMLLTDRDELLLLDLFDHRAMSRSQIERLGYFPSTHRANKRLRQLYDHFFVRRLFYSAGVSCAEALYLPGQASTALILANREVERPEVTRVTSRVAAPLFLPHTLRIVDVRIAFESHAKHVDVNVSRFRAEAATYHEYAVKTPSGGWKHHTLRPDGFVRLESVSGTDDYFLEVDLGHVSSKGFSASIERYCHYLSSGIFIGTYGSPSFRVLTITTSERRLVNLQSLTEKIHKPRFCFTTFAKLAEQGPFAPIWRTAGNTQASPLCGDQR